MKKDRKKTIAIFNGFYLPHLGGVERYTSKLIEQLTDYNIIIVTTNNDNYSDYEETENLKIYRLPTRKLFKNRFPILKKNKIYKDLVNRINKEKIDYVICNTRYYQTSILGAKLSKKRGIPLVFIEHSSNHISVGNKVLDYLGAHYEHYLTRKIKKYNPVFYGVSKKCNEWLKHFNIDAKGVFYNSIDESTYSEFHQKKDKSKNMIICYAGRIIVEKGIVNLLEAYETLLNKHNNIELHIAGDGPILSQLKEKYKNVKFLGKLGYDDVMKLYDKTDIFVHPSMYPEGLPTVILEAGIMKNAIIATDRGGTKEVICNSDCGFIVEENIEDLVDKIDMLLKQPELIEKMKENIHKRIIENFTWVKTSGYVRKELNKYGK